MKIATILTSAALTPLAFIALVGEACSRYSNEQLVKDAKFCTDSGFDYEILSDFGSRPIAVVCRKKT